MLHIAFQEKEKEIPLKGRLTEAQPFLLSLPSSRGEQQYLLRIDEGKGFRALCCSLDAESDLFIAPSYASAFQEIPSQTYLVITHDAHGYTAYFCLSHQNQRVSLTGHQRGMVLHIESEEADGEPRSALLCIRGGNLYQTISLTMRQALLATHGVGKLAEDKPPLPSWLETLGWESGASFGVEVTHEKILNAVWSLRQEGIQLGFVLIDEGWQYLSSKGASMLSFEADPKRFPLNLKGLVEDLHRAGVQHVGVWHGMMGARGGIHKQLAGRYELPCNKSGHYFLGSDLGRTFQFFHDYYRYLREQGISFVKVGDQSTASGYVKVKMGSTSLYESLQIAIQAAASIQLNTTHFNTDCLRNENLFYWTTSRIARVAADIDIQSSSQAKKAIRNNLTNTLWLQYLMQPDFGAWDTSTSQSESLAIFHALSGSINIISDPPCQHETRLIKKMVLPCGKLLKADKPLTLCRESVFVDPLENNTIYKAFTTKADTGILGVFNLVEKNKTLHGTVSPSDVEGLIGETFAVFSHYNGFVGTAKQQDKICITLKPNHSDVITFVPVKDGIAVIGCYPFFLAPGPISKVDVEEDSMHITSSITAPIVVYCERQLLEIRRNGEVVPWELDSQRHILSIDTRSNILSTPAVYAISFEA